MRCTFKRVAVAGIGVADHGNVNGVGDVLGVGDHLGHRQQPHVRETPLGGGAGPGHVNGVKPHRFGDAGVQPVDDEGGDDEAVGVEHLAQFGGGGHGGVLLKVVARNS